MTTESLVDFVNTLDLEAGEELFEDPTVLGRWLNRRGLIHREERIVSSEALERALAVREALREVLICHLEECEPPARALEVLKEAGRRAEFGLQVDPNGVVQFEPIAGGIDGALGRLLATVQAAQASGEWENLKACANDGCRWAFYDSSRNHSRRWCRMDVCGNRAKVQAHRARQSG